MIRCGRETGAAGGPGPTPGAGPARPDAPPVPPPPPVPRWHVAEGGATKGPFSKATMGRMAADGTLSRDSWWRYPEARQGQLVELLTRLHDEVCR